MSCTFPNNGKGSPGSVNGGQVNSTGGKIGGTRSGGK